MKTNIILSKIDFQATAFDEEYHDIIFEACQFQNTLIEETLFEECTFRQCDFSLCKFASPMHRVTFIDCKLVGADFTALNKFSSSLTFQQSVLNYANFTEVKLRQARFLNSQLKEVYFDRADLTQARFDSCDLQRTSFASANLERTDFSGSQQLQIIPSQVRLKKTIFTESQLRGLVAHLDIIVKSDF